MSLSCFHLVSPGLPRSQSEASLEDHQGGLTWLEDSPSVSESEEEPFLPFDSPIQSRSENLRKSNTPPPGGGYNMGNPVFPGFSGRAIPNDWAASHSVQPAAPIGYGKRNFNITRTTSPQAHAQDSVAQTVRTSLPAEAKPRNTTTTVEVSEKPSTPAPALTGRHLLELNSQIEDVPGEDRPTLVHAKPSKGYLPEEKFLEIRTSSPASDSDGRLREPSFNSESPRASSAFTSYDE